MFGGDGGGDDDGDGDGDGDGHTTTTQRELAFAAATSATAASMPLTDLPADALGLVLYQLTLAHDIAAVAPTCHVLCDAAKIALKLRPFSGEVVTLGRHTDSVYCVAASPDGRIVTGSADRTIKVWSIGQPTPNFTLEGHEKGVNCVEYFRGGDRPYLISGADDKLVKIWDPKLKNIFAKVKKISRGGQRAKRAGPPGCLFKLRRAKRAGVLTVVRLPGA